jgi:ferritin-like metal-binding protein YciE
MSTLKELFVMELQDLYDAENQIIKALPKMIKATSSPELRSGLEAHLQETLEHPKRIQQILESMDEDVKGKKCKGMQGLLAEGSELLGEKLSDEVEDAGIIGAAQRVEHYEIAAYGTARSIAELLELDDAVSLLEQTLEEEKAADEKLTAVSESVNDAANSAGEADAGDVDTHSRSKSRSRAKSAGA